MWGRNIGECVVLSGNVMLYQNCCSEVIRRMESLIASELDLSTRLLKGNKSQGHWFSGNEVLKTLALAEETAAIPLPRDSCAASTTMNAYSWLSSVQGRGTVLCSPQGSEGLLKLVKQRF